MTRRGHAASYGTNQSKHTSNYFHTNKHTGKMTRSGPATLYGTDQQIPTYNKFHTISHFLVDLQDWENSN